MTHRLWRGALAVFLLAGVIAGVTAAAADGRYKKQGERCVWDEKDSGPNQCAPLTAGRFKKEGDTCVWDRKDSGPDQCKPAKGRWKKEGERCEWSATDSGPNQCDPREVRK